jgi:DNA-binding LytR/AlgR family response regulator
MIVDDEPPAREYLHSLLAAHPDIEVVDSVGSAGQAVAAARAREHDLVFLDIQLPGSNGFEVLAELCTLPKAPLVVFATAYDSYAIQAFEANAVDYLLKPFSEERLAKSLDRVRQEIAGGREALPPGLERLLCEVGLTRRLARVAVEHRGRILLLDPGEIAYCLTDDKRVQVYTRESCYPCQGCVTLDKLETKLEGLSFFRANRSALVNLACIRECSPWMNGKYLLVMADAEAAEITVSRSRVREFKEKLDL